MSETLPETPAATDPEVDQADAQEQARDAYDDDRAGRFPPSRDDEVDPADAQDQATEVPLGDDEWP